MAGCSAKRGLRKKKIHVCIWVNKSSFRLYFVAFFTEINVSLKQIFFNGRYINDNPSAKMSKLVNYVTIGPKQQISLTLMCYYHINELQTLKKYQPLSA